MRRLRFALLLLLVGAAGPSAAQDRPARRAALEERVRQRLATVVRERLQLDDASMRRLLETNRRFESRQRELLRDERGIRLELRRQLSRDANADQARVDALLDRLLDVQRRRLDIVREEQRDLEAFLTPVQRARYLALQDELRRRVDEMRGRGQRRRTPGGGAPRGGRPDAEVPRSPSR